jgi:hypothetical protein
MVPESVRLIGVNKLSMSVHIPYFRVLNPIICDQDT